MRTVGLMIGLVALATAVWSDDIFTWTDAAGNVHYSNTSGADGATRTPGTVESRPADTAKATAPNAAGGAAPPDAESYSAAVSLRRNALERDLRATERKIRDLDGRLAASERARRQVAADTAAATGGVRPNLELRSDEEKALVAEREQLAQHTVDLKNEAVQLRQEVTARSGGSTPAWWIDVR
jgi:Domain of unknown function (DUF4124)